MKPIALLPVLIALGACARPDAPSPVESSTDNASSRPTTTAPDTVADAPRPPESPPARPGIAVGEPHPSGDAAIDPGPARLDGYGDLRFGMSDAEARKAWNGELQGDVVKPDNCAYLRPAGTAAGPFLMFEQGRLVRYDVHGANTTAPGGGRVGLSADDIRRLYVGRVEEQRHHYVQGGKYLRVVDPAAKGIVVLFEVDEHGRVTTWRVGRTPQVDYVEGCA